MWGAFARHVYTLISFDRSIYTRFLRFFGCTFKSRRSIKHAGEDVEGVGIPIYRTEMTCNVTHGIRRASITEEQRLFSGAQEKLFEVSPFCDGISDKSMRSSED